MSPIIPASLALGSPIGLPWIDTIGLGLVGLLLLVGVWRGLWWQVMRLAGLAVAVLAARALSPRLGPEILEAFPDLPARAAQGVAWAAIFVGVLLVALLLGILGRKTLKAMELGLVDRVGGGLAGAVTGLLIHVAAMAVLVQFAPTSWVQRQIGGTVSAEVLDAVARRWPVVLAAPKGEDWEGLFSAPDPDSEPVPRVR